MQFPSSTEANPHCGDNAIFSPTISFASKNLCFISSCVSKRAFFVEINPTTNVALLPFKIFHGSKPPERSSSYSTKNPSYGILLMIGATESYNPENNGCPLKFPLQKCVATTISFGLFSNALQETFKNHCKISFF